MKVYQINSRNNLGTCWGLSSVCEMVQETYKIKSHIKKRQMPLIKVLLKLIVSCAILYIFFIVFAYILFFETWTSSMYQKELLILTLFLWEDYGYVTTNFSPVSSTVVIPLFFHETRSKSPVLGSLCFLEVSM